MNFVLIRPFTNIKGKVFSFHPPLNLACLASYLDTRGITTTIIDFETENYNVNDLIFRIGSLHPIAVGITAYTNTIVQAGKIASDIKRFFPEMNLIVGGVHSTVLPVETLEEFPSFDFVVVGEGEETLADLLHSINMGVENVKGIVYRKNGELVYNRCRELIDNLDLLPFARRDLIFSTRNDRHFSRGILLNNKYITSIYTSRGCPYSCIFCAVNSNHMRSNKRVRYRSVENVIKEIEQCVKQYDFKHFCFLDDTFSLNKARLYPIADALKSFGVTWNCDIRANSIDQEATHYMKKSGCVKVSIGVESGSQWMLDLINKQITVEQVVEAFNICRKSKINIVEGTFMIASHPAETMDDINKTVELMHRVSPDFASLSIGTPYPGTELRDIMTQENLIDSNDWTQYTLSSSPAWHTTNFTSKELVNIQNKIVKDYYFNIRFLLKILKSPKLFIHMLIAGFQFFKLQK